MNKRHSIILFTIVSCAALGYSYPKYEDCKQYKQANQNPLVQVTAKKAPSHILYNFFEEPHIDFEEETFVVLDLSERNASDSIYFINTLGKVYPVDFFNDCANREDFNILKKYKGKVKVINASFENIDWNALPRVDCIIAIHSPSFISKKEVDRIWRKMYQHLKPKGLVITRLFGEALRRPNMSHMVLLNEKKIRNLTKDFKILYYNERQEHKGRAVDHAFNLILQKA